MIRWGPVFATGLRKDLEENASYLGEMAIKTNKQSCSYNQVPELALTFEF